LHERERDDNIIVHEAALTFKKSHKGLFLGEKKETMTENKRADTIGG
jgi:hypothetical protein